MSEPGLFGELRWTPTELGAALALTTQRLSQLTKEGILPSPVDGRFHPQDTVRAYVQHLRKREAGRSQADEALKKMQLENEMRQIRLQKLAGELVPVDRVAKDWFEVSRRVRDALLNLPSRLSGPFAAESNQEKIFALFTEEIHVVLTELSSGQRAVPSASRAPVGEVPEPGQSLDEADALDQGSDGPPAPPNFEEAFLDRGDEDPGDRFSDGD